MVRKRATGKSGEILLMLAFRKFLKVSNPVVVSMLVYIDFASAEKSSAFSGISRCFTSFISFISFYRESL
jgi:hypothetical protein